MLRRLIIKVLNGGPAWTFKAISQDIGDVAFHFEYPGFTFVLRGHNRGLPICLVNIILLLMATLFGLIVFRIG